MLNAKSFPHPLFRTKDAEGVPVFAFTFEDFVIHNPFESTCGRFEEKPDAYGLTEAQGLWLLNLNTAISLSATAALKEGARTIESTVEGANFSSAVSHLEGSDGHMHNLSAAMADCIEAELRRNGFNLVSEESDSPPGQNRTAPRP